MICFLHHPAFPGERFSLQVPETIACRENTQPLWLINHNEASFHWTESNGIVRLAHTKAKILSLTAELTPYTDHVDILVSITNLSQDTWHNVFSFNCFSPNEVTAFKDEKMRRTYLPVQGLPMLMGETTRTKGPRPTIQVYAHEAIEADQLPPFMRAFQATSPNRVDNSWMAKTTRSGEYLMAVISPSSNHLFNNQALGCLHASAEFGTMLPGETRAVVSRVYIMPKSLEEFLGRVEEEQVELRHLSKNYSASKNKGATKNR